MVEIKKCPPGYAIGYGDNLTKAQKKRRPDELREEFENDQWRKELAKIPYDPNGEKDYAP